MGDRNHGLWAGLKAFHFYYFTFQSLEQIIIRFATPDLEKGGKYNVG